MATAAAAANSLIEHIHHERQESGSMLCAQHALNALLQGAYYDPSQLADIAKQVDEFEQVHVVDEETWRNRDQASLNMDDTGFFSVSVLEKALEVWGLRLIRWRSEQMRAFQRQPEQQLAFVLNLDSHWFTIRGFQGGYWFNLNSFLEKPSWVGPSYLGALLGAAESEGYSVFVAIQSDDARNDFHSSVADQCAATLPPASALMNEQDQAQTEHSDVTSSMTHGLKPSAAAKTSIEATTSSSSSAVQDPFSDEEADLQAALQASLAVEEQRHARVRLAATSTSTSESSPGSRMHSPTIAGQRRTRSGVMVRGPSTDAEMSFAAAEGENDDAETDEQVDAIAPSRRRVRGMAGRDSRNSPYVLPTASGGRRRASRQHSEDGGEQAAASRRRRQQQHQQQQQQQQQQQRDAGSSRDTAISVDDMSGIVDRDSNAPIVVRDDDDSNIESGDEDDDFAHMLATSAPRSPFLNPALAQSGGAGTGTNSDDDFHSLSSGDEDGSGGGQALLGESWVQHDIDAVQRHAAMRTQRTYDDEDAELQAALAASMREAGGGAQGASLAAAANEALERGAAPPGSSFEDDLAAASWINEEDSRAIREAQASFANMVRQASKRSSASPPPPADVERIAKMRAEAKRKATEEQEALLRGTTGSTDVDGNSGQASGSGAGQHTGEKSKANNSDSDDDDDDEPEMSPEEIRRARLARFGGP